MGLIEIELGKALNTGVKRKSNNTRNLRAIAKRVTKPKGAGGSSEVMVKITGFGKGADHVQAHLLYISRNGEVEIENDRNEIFTGKEEVKELFQDLEKDFGDSKRHKNQRDTMNVVLSMPEGTDPELVRKAVREFTKAQFGENHEYFFALHTDEPHPHCHVAVKCLGFDGKRLNPRKADLQEWREGFAEKMRAQGVDAEATPRQSRGVTKKAQKSVIRHIEHGDKTHEPRVAKVTALKIKEVALELSAEAKGLPVLTKPWEEAIKARQREIRRAWLAAADALEQEDTRKTFNNKEVKNDRPDYERISADRARPGQRAAAVYQSNLERAGRQTPPGTLASVRNLSGLSVVHNERSSQMLLQPNASDRLGWQRTTDTEMRRSRVGDSRAPGGEKQLKSYVGTAAENKALAASIRAFVEAMPEIKTEREQIKEDLTQKFTRQAEKVQIPAPTPKQSPKAGVERPADVPQKIVVPPNVDKDIER